MTEYLKFEYYNLSCVILSITLYFTDFNFYFKSHIIRMKQKYT